MDKPSLRQMLDHAGVRIDASGSIADLLFREESARSRWLRVVGPQPSLWSAGDVPARSWYYQTRWRPEFERFCRGLSELVPFLQDRAVCRPSLGSPLAVTLPEIADWAVVSLRTVQRWREIIQSPDEPQEIAAQALRLWVPRAERGERGNDPYLWSVLSPDCCLIHPLDWPLFLQWQGDSQSPLGCQGVTLRVTGSHPKGDWESPSLIAVPATITHEIAPREVGCHGVTLSSVMTDSIHDRVMAPERNSGITDGEFQALLKRYGRDGLTGQTNQFLVGERFRSDTVDYVCRDPLLAYCAWKIGLWMRDLKVNYRTSRDRYLSGWARRAAEGKDPRARQLPGSLEYEAARKEREIERSKSRRLVNSRPDPPAESSSAPSPSAPVQPLPRKRSGHEALDGYMDVLFEYAEKANGMALAYLIESRPLGIEDRPEGPCLILEVAAPIHVDLLRRQAPKMLARIRERAPQFPDLEVRVGTNEKKGETDG